MLCFCRIRIRIPTEADVAFTANINGRKERLCFLVEVVCFLIEVSNRLTTISHSELQPLSDSACLQRGRGR